MMKMQVLAVLHATSIEVFRRCRYPHIQFRRGGKTILRDQPITTGHLVWINTCEVDGKAFPIAASVGLQVLCMKTPHTGLQATWRDPKPIARFYATGISGPRRDEADAAQLKHPINRQPEATVSRRASRLLRRPNQLLLKGVDTLPSNP